MESVRKEPVSGEIFRHFKNKLYQIVGVATHSETKEKLVIYQALYDEFGIYARPYEMFMSEVDRVKYPHVLQKYRFERVGRAGECKDISISADTNNYQEILTDINCDNEKKSKPIYDSAAAEEEKPNSDLIAFLDAETFDEKHKLLVAMRSRITDRLINDIAASLDITVEEGDIETRYKSLLYCVKKMDEFEVTRLR